VSFDLVVLAVAADAGPAEVRMMSEHCTSGRHRDGELDERIVAFYEELRSRYPDYPPYEPESPWMSQPLAVGIDHVILHVTYSPRGDEAVTMIMELAQRHQLIIYDPQSDEITGLAGNPGRK